MTDRYWPEGDGRQEHERTAGVEKSRRSALTLPRSTCPWGKRHRPAAIPPKAAAHLLEFELL